jgi:NAD(P)-dependent dehydrogenase (short-subunit alcohol dehydrogenase family)
MLERGAAPSDPARIINIGSVDGIRVPAPETFAYSASKAGLHHMSRVLANHLGRRNITYGLFYLDLWAVANLNGSDLTRLPAARSKAK